MRKYFNKLYLSIALVVLSLLTMVATTYAWVGLLTSTTFDEFSINLQQSDGEIEDYGLEFSLTGELGSFKEKLDQVEIRRTLLTNAGVDVSRYNDNVVNEMFRKYRLEQCTTTREGTYSLGSFKNMRNEDTTKYFWFDLYVSIFKIGAEDDGQSEKKLNLYLRKKILSASTPTNADGIYTMRLVNSVTYPSANPIGEQILGRPGGIQLGSNIHDEVSIDIANSCRVALEKYDTAPKGDLSIYSLNNRTGLFIYQKGSKYPMYNEYTKVYDFGGILPMEYNFAKLYFDTTHPDNNLDTVFTSVDFNNILNRGDTTFADDGVTNQIINQSDNVTTSTMSRFRIYFWYEGWDSNCFDVVDNKEVTVNLSFSTKNPNED